MDDFYTSNLPKEKSQFFIQNFLTKLLNILSRESVIVTGDFIDELTKLISKGKNIYYKNRNINEIGS